MPDQGTSAAITGEFYGFLQCQNVHIGTLYLGTGVPPPHLGTGVLPPESLSITAPLDLANCPYRGLSSFTPREGHLFFGRDRAISQIEAAVTQHPLTAVIGPSGCGKSSVVLAGLTPRLMKMGWMVSHFRIGTEQDRTPFMALARAVQQLLTPQDSPDQLERVQALAKGLESNTISLPNALSECRRRSQNRRILLIADQFEEVFTLVSDETLQRRYIETLLSGFPLYTDSSQPQMPLVMTLRGDFYGQALLNRKLSDALQGRVVNLGSMTRSELTDAIVKPAGAVRFEPGLVDKLLDDVEDNPGSLPLLQFALVEMWKRQQNAILTRRDYEAIGGVCGALAQQAQKTFDALTDRGQRLDEVRAFRRLFTRMVAFGEGGHDSRRVVDRSELHASDWALAQRLASEDNRIVMTGEKSAEFAHEALIKNWPALHDWINEDAAFQLWLRQLKSPLDTWKVDQRDQSRLLSGYSLAAAEQWLKTRSADMSEGERDYVLASIHWRDAQTRREKRRRRLLLAAATIASLAIAAAWWRTKLAYDEAQQDRLTLFSASGWLASTAQDQFLPSSVAQSKTAFAKALLQPLSEMLSTIQGHPSNMEALAELQLLELLWNTHYILGDMNRASQAANRELRLSVEQAQAGEQRPEWLYYAERAQENLGDLARDESHLPQAEAHFREAVRFATRLAAQYPQTRWKNELAHAHERLGDSYRGERQFPRALQEFNSFLALSIEPEDQSADLTWLRNVAVIHGKEGDMLLAQGNLAGAEREFETDLALSEKLSNKQRLIPDFRRGVAVAHERLGFVKRRLGDLAGAAADYREDLAVATDLVTSDSEITAWLRDQALANQGLGDVAFDEHNWNSAVDAYRKYRDAMLIWFRKSPSDAWVRRDVAIGYQRVGMAEAKLGDMKAARSAFEQCLSYSKGASTAFDPRNPDPANTAQSCSQQEAKLQ